MRWRTVTSRLRTIALADGQSINDGFAAFQETWDPPAPPPAVTVYIVAGLANPEFLVEIDAIAAV